MGVPKFFRYISERYPCLSEVVREYQLPEFDNLYLDMNGIIHICSHPNDADPHFRITEEKIFRDIFHYIETLFRMIQPQKLFFMAVDGVAPRAKMNQQRGRRFRSAKDAEIAEAKARDRGELLPSEDRFDSNCITPGTEFMTRLHAQLKYFVTFKVSTDKLWQKVKVILSGHEVPGEGEHKIMDYIRYMKSQPGYDHNTRHCLYGLDADLIMLGLCTHEPHFSLLREEVKYGKKNSQKRIPTPEETTFFLLHLSLMREYLDLEFQQLKKSLSFPYDLEHIIDDWVLMGFLVGNDFIPHLPDLHINKGALPLLYKTYIEVLPTLGGYINEGGTLRLDRFQKYMEKLAAFDLEQFKETSADLHYFESKTGRTPGSRERHSYKNNYNEFCSPTKNKDLAALIASTEEMLEGSDDDDENYIDIDSDDEDEADTSIAEFCAHKNNYYMEKLEYDKVTPEVLRSQAEGYVRAIQWNLNYYYNGCCSWSWFYPHHYAPYVSDIKNFSGLKLEYEMGQPFLPFQQLLAVLPAASKKLLPEAYHDLMVNDESPIIQFYPTEFKTDLNGKRQDWEAVVLIPFIEQESLLQAMGTKESELTEEEKSRNRHGPMQVYTYSPDNLGSYVSPAYFPALANHHAREENVFREEILVDRSKLVRGLCPNVKLDVYFLGFPTLKHIPFTAGLKKAKVKVFESPSQGDNMILTILPQGHPNVSEVASQLLGKSIFVNWPHMFEARVVSVSNLEQRFSLNLEDNSTEVEQMNKTLQAQWTLTKNSIEERYMNRMGIDVGPTEILVFACTLEDRKFVVTEDKIKCEKQWSKLPIAYALQLTRTNIAINESSVEPNLTLENLYPTGSTVFLLDSHSQHFGAKGTVAEVSKNQRVKLNLVVESEPNLDQIKNKLRKISPTYSSGNNVAQKLGISSFLLSRITGTIYVNTGDIEDGDRKPYKLNIGLNLKFNKRNEEVCGFTRRDKNGYWLYSVKAEQEVDEYMKQFPEVFSVLSKKSESGDVNANELYPENTTEKLAELDEWLKGLNSRKAERQTCGAQVLEEEVVQMLEQMIDHFIKNEMTVKHVTVHAKPSSIYLPKPKLGQAPEPKAKHHLFDRIINVRESHTVALGARGTIIGIHDADKGPQAMYDILFDKEFTGGLKLRTSPHRGYRLPAQAFINHTYCFASEQCRAQGKPTAVVEPTGTEEEVGIWNNNGHNSAFASWRSKLNHDLGSPRHSGSEHKNRSSFEEQSFLQSLEQSSRNKPNTPNVNKAGSTGKGQMNKGLSQSNSEVGAEFNLKKILKIKDDKVPPAARENYHSPDNRPTIIDNRGPHNSQNPSNYCMQLLSLHHRFGKKLPRYKYIERPDGSMICCVVCYNGMEFLGVPVYSNDKLQAAENAAQKALQCLASEDQRGTAFVPPPYLQPGRQPLLLTPQRPNFSPGNRMPIGHSPGWTREPAKPSTLPQPPTNWYQNPRAPMPNFQPEWRLNSPARPVNNYFNSSLQYQHNQLQHNQHGPFNQHNQMGSRQHRNPFVPLQAESRLRQQPTSREQDNFHEPPKNTTPSRPTEQNGSRTISRGANHSGRTSTRPQRPRIAANFSKPFTFSPENSQGPP